MSSDTKFVISHFVYNIRDPSSSDLNIIGVYDNENDALKVAKEKSQEIADKINNDEKVATEKADNFLTHTIPNYRTTGSTPLIEP